MSATDHLGVQFRRADEDEDKHADADVKGQDEDTEFGYSGYDMADYQYRRYGRDETATNPRREVF